VSKSQITAEFEIMSLLTFSGDKMIRFRLYVSMLPFCGLSFCLSVCLTSSCIVLKRQKISARFLSLGRMSCFMPQLLDCKTTFPPHSLQSDSNAPGAGKTCYREG